MRHINIKNIFVVYLKSDLIGVLNVIWPIRRYIWTPGEQSSIGQCGKMGLLSKRLSEV
jgi:hypothetical protein